MTRVTGTERRAIRRFQALRVGQPYPDLTIDPEQFPEFVMAVPEVDSTTPAQDVELHFHCAHGYGVARVSQERWGSTRTDSRQRSLLIGRLVRRDHAMRGVEQTPEPRKVWWPHD